MVTGRKGLDLFYSLAYYVLFAISN